MESSSFNLCTHLKYLLHAFPLRKLKMFDTPRTLLKWLLVYFTIYAGYLALRFLELSEAAGDLLEVAAGCIWILVIGAICSMLISICRGEPIDRWKDM